MKKLVFLDMDDVIADFMGHFGGKRGPDGFHLVMHEEGFFENLKPMPGSLTNVRKLFNHPDIDLHILSQPVKESAHSYSEKARWLMKWFPELAPRVTLTQNKEFLSAPGRFLIDDNHKKWKEKWETHGGRFIHFYEDIPEQSWGEVFETLGIK
jgi:5'(3')-deoxyribonucleotidase